MKGISRVVVGGLSTVALATLALTAPAAASNGELACTYQWNQQVGRVTGGCAGSTDFGSAAGSFTGHLRPGGIGSGNFVLDTPAGSYSGSFKGKPFHGGKAKGTWYVRVGSLTVTGTFVAVCV